MHTTASVRPVQELLRHERDAMFALMTAHFDAVDREAFEHDLAEKTWAILLTASPDNRIVGFTTLQLMEAVVDATPVRAFYSGDTIIAPAYWNTFSLERQWIPLVFSQALAPTPFKWYWFLVCKGYRTYRYLPVYFRRYYPGPGWDMPPFEKRVLDALAQRQFGRHYDPQQGVARLPRDYRLRPGVSDVTAAELRRPHVAFFVRQNPDWPAGAELACLAELTRENVKPMVLKLLAENV